MLLRPGLRQEGQLLRERLRSLRVVPVNRKTLVLLLVAAGCGLFDPSSQPSHPSAGDVPAAEGAADAGATGPRSAKEVCERWRADRKDLRDAANGVDAATCTPGTLSPIAHANALRLVNLYRWMAGLAPVTSDAGRDAAAQECALMMAANGTLDHAPPSSWTCWTAAGAEAAANSNLAAVGAVPAVDLYMEDFGNFATLGHRRWLLSNRLGPVGIGSAGTHSCLWAIGAPRPGASWVAWPPPGPYPAEALTLVWKPIEETGWSLQSDTVALGLPEVTVTSDGALLPVKVVSLAAGVGSEHGIGFIADGWKSEAGKSYHVQVGRGPHGGPEPAIEWDVSVVDCDAVLGGD